MRHLGRLWEREELHGSSPINQVERIQAPLMLAVSSEDSVVNPRQTARMHKALKKKGKTVQLVELPEGDHYLSRQANRKTFAEALLVFLEQNLRESMPQLAKGDSGV
jgi:dipeptidyl aminopeptidase/acylaminoacyl peptidase